VNNAATMMTTTRMQTSATHLTQCKPSESTIG
jgi:hypothetical protein